MMLDPMFLVFLVVSGIVLIFVTFKVLQNRDDRTGAARQDYESKEPVDSLSADSPQWDQEDTHKHEKSKDQL